MVNKLISVQMIPPVPPREDFHNDVDSATKVIEDVGVKHEVLPLKATIKVKMGELLSAVEKTNLRENDIFAQIKLADQSAGNFAEKLSENDT